MNFGGATEIKNVFHSKWWAQRVLLSNLTCLHVLMHERQKTAQNHRCHVSDK